MYREEVFPTVMTIIGVITLIIIVLTVTSCVEERDKLQHKETIEYIKQGKTYSFGTCYQIKGNKYD